MPFGNRKKIFLSIFLVQYYLNLKKYHLSGKLKYYNLRILKSLKLRILVKEILPISLKPNFTPNTLGCKGLSKNYPFLTREPLRP